MGEFFPKLKLIFQLVLLCIAGIVLSFVVFFFLQIKTTSAVPQATVATAEVNSKGLTSAKLDEPRVWIAPDSTAIPTDEEGKLIQYGRDLIANTSAFLGPHGSVRQISNGMNCQNCHLKAGTKPFGNNYSAVASTYPKFRARSGSVETISKRVNDCIERSLNGKKLADDSREMKAIIAYMHWVGQNVKKGESPLGSGIKEPALIKTSADPVKGKALYLYHCQRCHGTDAKGKRNEAGTAWLYPPLAGDSSFNIGAGLYRLSRFAGFIKANMPYGVSFDNPILKDEEAWHIAGYINSLPRPKMNLASDWPDIASKPYDHPFGPYADAFTEEQHKLGPFDVIKSAAPKK